MSKLNDLASCVLVALIAPILAPLARCQPNPSPRQFLESVLANKDRSKIPPWPEWDTVGKTLYGAAPQDVSSALPSLAQVIADPNTRLQEAGVLTLLAISYRTDSPTLLAGYHSAIVGLLQSERPVIAQSAASMIAGILSRSRGVQTDLLDPLLALLQNKHRDPIAQARAISCLIKYAPENWERRRDANAAIAAFLTTPQEGDVTITALYAVAEPRASDSGIVLAIIDTLKNSDVAVRLTALDTLNRIGRPAVVQAANEIGRLAADPSQPPDVRSSARKLLEENTLLR